MNYALMALIGALAAILANQGVAVFNDGFRPIVSQYFEGKMTRAELAATSFAVSFGLVIGFGIPSSIGASIFLVHSILLATDIIGTVFPPNKKGRIGAGAVGAIYGMAIYFGLEFLTNLFHYLPYNFLDPLGSVSSPVVAMFSVFPAIAVAMQHGFQKGLITFLVSLISYFMTQQFGTFQGENVLISLNPEGIALFFGVILMVVFAVQQKGEESTHTELMHLFSDQAKRIQRNKWLLALMGGLLSAAAAIDLMAGDPASLALMQEGQYTNAAIAAFARSIGFIPLVFSTAIVTGVYGTAGVTIVWGIGILLHGNPFLAFLLGAVLMAVEVSMIGLFAKGLDHFPGVRDMGEHIRDAMNKVLSVALLIGGANAANTMAPGVGALFVGGFYLLNRQSKKPLVDLAVGPVAAILFGILLNLLALVGMYLPPVA